MLKINTRHEQSEVRSDNFFKLNALLRILKPER